MTTVLVVDDSADIRLLLSTLLRADGSEVVEAAAGREALDVLATTSPDLVLLDLQMPGMDGWDTLAAIRSSSSSSARDIPVVLCTVKSSRSDRARAWEMACDGYLVKPFDIDELLREVREVTVRDAAERKALCKGRLAALRATGSENT